MSRLVTSIITILLMLCTGLIQCANQPVADSGSGSTTTNGIIAASYFNADGSPAQNTEVCLVPEGFDPVKEGNLPDSLTGITDSNGTCRFSLSYEGTFNLQAYNPTFNTYILQTGISVVLKDTVLVGAATLRMPGTFTFTLPDTADMKNGYVYVPGTLLYKKIADEQVIVDNGKVHLVFDQLPAGTVAAIYYGEMDVPMVSVELQSDVTIEEGDTTEVLLYESWQSYTTQNSGIPEDRVTKVLVDATGTVWVGTMNSGVATFNGSDWKGYSTANSVLQHNTIQGLGLADDGTVWIATVYGIASVKQDTWEIFTAQNSTLPDNNLTDIAFDNEGNLWAGAQQGCIIYDGTGWKQSSYTGTFPMAFVTSIAVAGTGDVFIGTPYGIFRHTGGAFSYLPVPDFGAVEVRIEDIAGDSRGNMWFATERGVVHYASGSWQVFDANTGLPGTVSKSVAVDYHAIPWAGLSEIGAVVKIGHYYGVYTSTNTGVLNNAGAINDIAVADETTFYFATESGGLVRLQFMYTGE